MFYVKDTVLVESSTLEQGNIQKNHLAVRTLNSEFDCRVIDIGLLINVSNITISSSVHRKNEPTSSMKRLQCSGLIGQRDSISVSNLAIQIFATQRNSQRRSHSGERGTVAQISFLPICLANFSLFLSYFTHFSLLPCFIHTYFLLPSFDHSLVLHICEGLAQRQITS